MSLDKYLNKYSVTDYEGNSGNILQQTNSLKHLVSDIDILNILEIGFNAGHSADSFLSSSLAHVTSFDINIRGSVKYAKEYIDKKYPSRHTLIIGDSTKMIPEYAVSNPTTKFDVIFIDGGHTYELAIADLLNCKNLAHKNTIVIMDDTIFNIELSTGWTIGPSKAWLEGILNKCIDPINKELYGVGRGMSWGKYIF